MRVTAEHDRPSVPFAFLSRVFDELLGYCYSFWVAFRGRKQG
jgi:hypothetical protein